MRAITVSRIVPDLILQNQIRARHLLTRAIRGSNIPGYCLRSCLRLDSIGEVTNKDAFRLHMFELIGCTVVQRQLCILTPHSLSGGKNASKSCGYLA